ncbi:MAG: alpha/beta hydrolase [Candidatus Omnitrophica bacterium]|nr:alpha/beta hydrolase [Candidatus Omnitrophota bacterium]
MKSKFDVDMKMILDQYAKFNAPPLETLSVENARNLPTLKNAVEELMAENPAIRATTLVKPMPQPVKISHHLIPGPQGDILARVYIPDGEGPFPVLVYFHGGGWVIANLDVYEPSCRALCKKAKSVVVSVAYRQAPEHKYPAAVDDAYAATQWVIVNASIFNGNPDQVAVCGESAGGNLATVTCLKARDERGRMPAAQVLIYPVIDARMKAYSYKENSDTAPLNSAMMPWFWKHYLQGEIQGLEPYASPIMAQNLSGLPPAIIITAEHDPLRDEGEAYAARLVDAGVPVRGKRYNGVSHEFFGLAGLVHKAGLAVQESADGLREIFNGLTVHHES